MPEPTVTVKSIVEEWLHAHPENGLRDMAGLLPGTDRCCCHVDDLMLCDAVPPTCSPCTVAEDEGGILRPVT